MDEKPYTSEPGAPKTDAQIVGILKNGSGGGAGNVTPTADTALNELVPTAALNGHLEKLAAGGADGVDGGDWPVPANRRKSLTPSVTVDMTSASGSGEQNGAHHPEERHEVNNGQRDEDEDDVDDSDSDDGHHTPDDPVSQLIRGLHLCSSWIIRHNWPFNILTPTSCSRQRGGYTGRVPNYTKFRTQTHQHQFPRTHFIQQSIRHSCFNINLMEFTADAPPSVASPPFSANSPANYIIKHSIVHQMHISVYTHTHTSTSHRRMDTRSPK